MSYLNISQAAWSLVLSKDPRIKPKPTPPGCEAACSNFKDTSDADPITTPATTSAQQQTKDQASAVVTANVRSSICMHSKSDALAQANREAASSKPSDTHITAAQEQVKRTAVEEDKPSLPLELKIDAAASQVQAPAAWSPSSGEQPSRWLVAAHGPAWHEEAAAAGRQAAAAHRHLLGLLEKRRAALLKDLGRARDLDLKRLLQLVATYTDDVQALLESGQDSALQAQQSYVQHLTATAAAAVGGSIEVALQAAHKTHQQQVSMMQQNEATKLEAARLSAKQQLTAALELQQRQAQQQLEKRTKQLNDGWLGRCKAAEAAAEKESALRAHADTECNKLRSELAAARRELATCWAHWERGSSTAGASSSISGFNMSSSMSGALEGSAGRPLNLAAAASGSFAAAFDVNCSAMASMRRTSRPSPPE